MSITTPITSWEAIVSESATYTGDYNYTCKLTKTNPNDPGYGTLVVGYYIVDYVGHLFEITGINFGGDSEAVIVHDLLERDEEEGPYGLRESYVYDSLYAAALVSQAKLNRLDESAEDFIRNLNVDPKMVDSVQFNTAYTPDTEPEGLVWWNTGDNTMNISTGYGSILQVGQEIHIKVYNNSGETISDGTAVYPTGAFNDFPTIGKARTDTHETVAVDYGMTTTSIDDGEYGFVTWFGKVRGIDTSMWNLGDRLWISPTNPGEMVNIQPVFPNYAIQIGIVFIKDSLDGQIFVTSRDTVKDTIQNFWNGVFRESFDFRISSNGTTITGSLDPNNGHDDMTMMFSDGFTLLDTNPAATITLTPGTADIPQQNFIYIPQSTKVLTVSTSDWPTTTEHIKVAQVLLRTAILTQEEGALRNQNWNDHLQCTTTGQGHLSHMGERMRQNDSKWESGTEGSVVIDAGAVSVKNTSGVVYQMHRQTFPLLDMTQYTIDAVSQGSKTFTISGDGDLTSTFPDSRLIKVNDSTGNDAVYTIVSTNYADPDFVITVEESIASAVVDGTIGDVIHIVNHDTTPYTSLKDLANVVNDASGDVLNNTSFSIVVWGVQNKTGEESHLMANLPSASYSKNFPQQSVDDAFNHSVYDIPKAFQGVGFLIARFTFVNTSGVWTLYDTEDLRGKTPNTTAGGGAGGAGVTSFLGLGDTPSAYTAQAEKLIQVNAAETALEFVTDIKTDSIDEWTTDNGILLGNTLTVDQANNRIGVNITNPSTSLEVIDAAGDSSLQISTSIYGSNITATLGSSLGILYLQSQSNEIRTVSYASGDPKWAIYDGTATQKIRINSGGDSYFNGGNVGIGIDSPNVLLQLNKADSTGAKIQFTNATTGSGANNGIWIGQDNTENAQFYNFANTDMYFGTNDSVKMIIKNTGNVGIGTNSPSGKFHVYQDTGVGQFYFDSEDNKSIIYIRSNLDNIGVEESGIYLMDGTTNKWELYKTNTNDFAIYDFTGSKTSFRIEDNGNMLLMEDSGNVGIGTDSPVAALDIVHGTTGYPVIRLTDVITDATNKIGIMLGRHYLNSEQDVLGFWFSNISTGGRLIFGGGSSAYNSVNSMLFLTGDGSAVLGGTTRMTIAGDGVISISNSLTVDTISEYTTDAGVTIDSILIKDGRATNSSSAAPTADAELANKKYVDDSITSPMVYPGAGIALSTGSAWGTSITNNSGNWNTAYGWGDHSGLYADTSHANTHITGGSDIIADFTSTASGIVPLSGGGTTNFLRADGTWATPSGGITYTFDEGLDENSGTVRWGYSSSTASNANLLTNPVYLKFDTSKNLSISSYDNVSSVTKRSLFDLDELSIEFQAGDASNNYYSDLSLTHSIAQLKFLSGADSASIDIYTNVVKLNVAADGAILSAQPTGGTDLAIATTKYVDDNAGGGTPTDITVANEATDTTCFLSFFTAATGDLGPKTNTNLQFNSSTGDLSIGGDVFIGGTSAIDATYPVSVEGDGIVGRSVVTDGVAKTFGLLGGHKTNAEEAVMGIMISSALLDNTINIGGGSSDANAATKINFYGAANYTTVTGTIRGTIDSNGLSITGGIDVGDTGVYLKTKVLEIDTWNMNTLTNKNVAHGLTLANIRNVEVIIRNDSGTTHYKLDYSASSGSNEGRYNIDATNVALNRTLGGLFDSTSFETAIDDIRGWIIITYV